MCTLVTEYLNKNTEQFIEEALQTFYDYIRSLLFVKGIGKYYFAVQTTLILLLVVFCSPYALINK